MGLLSNMKKSVFDSSIYGAVENKDNGSCSITITPLSRRSNQEDKTLAITGVLQGDEGLKLKASADWQKLDLGMAEGGGVFGAISEAIGAIGTIGRWTGYGFGDAGIATRKYYNGNQSYISIEPTFRVVDWNGSGETIKAAILLLNLCLPAQLLEKDGVVQDFKNVLAEVEKWLAAQDSPANKIKDWLGKSDLAVAKVAQRALNFEQYGLSVDNLAQSLTQSPTSVTVRIGNYFKHEQMVITDVSVDFSREVTTTGPLYADFTVGISSLQTMIVGPNGLMPTADRGINKAGA
jgi:hypothetical protein